MSAPRSRSLGDEPLLHAGAIVRESALGRFVEIGEGSHVAGSSIGDYSYCARYADIANSDIGKFVSIAAFTRLNPGDHPMTRASQHHFMYRASLYFADAEDEAAVFEWRARRRVHIGHDVWIGHGAVITAETDVGVGAVIGAGAVVTKPVPPYEVWGGTPARKLKDRHPPAVAERLMALAWWDWPHARIRTALEDFRTLSAEMFLEKHQS